MQKYLLLVAAVLLAMALVLSAALMRPLPVEPDLPAQDDDKTSARTEVSAASMGSRIYLANGVDRLEKSSGGTETRVIESTLYSTNVNYGDGWKPYHEAVKAVKKGGALEFAWAGKTLRLSAALEGGKVGTMLENTYMGYKWGYEFKLPAKDSVLEVIVEYPDEMRLLDDPGGTMLIGGQALSFRDVADAGFEVSAAYGNDRKHVLVKISRDYEKAGIVPGETVIIDPTLKDYTTQNFQLGNYTGNTMWNGSGVTLRFREAAPENDAISMWHFNDLYDSSYYGNNATAQSGAQVSSGALSFGSGNGWANAADSPIYDTGGTVSVELWFRTTDAQDSKTLLVHDQSPESDYKYMIYLDITSELLSFYVTTASGADSVTWNTGTPSYFSSGRWHQVVGTFNRSLSSGRLKIYVDGQFRNSRDSYNADVAAGDDGIVFGKRGTAYFKGEMDEVAIYNRTLGADEIYLHYLQRFGTGNYSSQVFDGGSSTSLWDLIKWSGSQPSGANITIQARSCSISDCSDSAWIGPDNTSSTFFTSSPAYLNSTNISRNRYFQYRAFLQSNNTNVTPVLASVNVTYNARYAANVLNVYGAGNCSTLLDDAQNFGIGSSCGTSCVVMNASINVTEYAVLTLSSCKLVMNNTAAEGTSNIYVMPTGTLEGYGLNLTSVNSNRFYFYGMAGSSANFTDSWVSYADFRGPAALFRNSTLSGYAVTGQGMIEVKKYINAYVNTTANVSSSGATVSFYNVTGNYHGQFTTVSNGWAYGFNATEYVQTAAGKSNYVNYTVTATKTGYGVTQLVSNLSLATNLSLKISSTPVLSYSNITPYAPNTTDSLNCTFNVTDADGPCTYVNITWYRGSTHVTAYDVSSLNLSNRTQGWTTSLVPASATNSNEVWNCSVTAWDGYSLSSTKNASVTIIGMRPFIYPPETYEGSSRKTTFSAGDTVRITVNVTDQDGAGDLEGAYLTLSSEIEGVISNASMTQTGSITNGRVYEYNYTLPDGPSGTWTIVVYANDTGSDVSYNVTTFHVSIMDHKIYIGVRMDYTDAMVHVPGSGEQSAGTMANSTYTSLPRKYLASYAGGALKGIIFSGASHLSLGFERNGGNHTLRSVQYMEGSQVIIPFARGDWNAIENRISDIEAGRFLSRAVASFSHGMLDEHTIDLFLTYSNIDLAGNHALKSGWRKITLENNGTSSGKVVVAVTVE